MQKHSSADPASIPPSPQKELTKLFKYTNKKIREIPEKPMLNTMVYWHSDVGVLFAFDNSLFEYRIAICDVITIRNNVSMLIIESLKCTLTNFFI